MVAVVWAEFRRQYLPNMNGENASHSAEMLGNYEKNLRTFVPEV
jgi:hypothetical protein